MKKSKISLSLPVEYVQAELDEKASRLSSAMLEYDEIEEQKKAATSQFSDQLKAIRGEVRQLAKQIRRKGEDRAVDCIVQFHTPQPAFKTIIRQDTGEIVRTEAMSYEESQENLFEEAEDINRMYSAEDPRPEKPSQDQPEA